MPNYNLFSRYFSKIAQGTIKKFGSGNNISDFLAALTRSGNVVAALNKVENITISPMEIHNVISKDKFLTKCVNLSLSLANELAEGALFDRAVNGYSELIYDETGRCISTRKKYCTKSLLEYLKTNSPKYRNLGRRAKDNADEQEVEDVMPMWEIKSFAEPDDNKEPA